MIFDRLEDWKKKATSNTNSRRNFNVEQRKEIKIYKRTGAGTAVRLNEITGKALLLISRYYEASLDPFFRGVL